MTTHATFINRPAPRRAVWIALLVVALLAVPLAGSSAAADKRPAPKPTIVLVHGAFADASGWTDVASRLQRDGYTVLAPANPLRGVDSDSAYIRSVLETIDGPVVVVGHSYGGFVATNAATGNTNVKALVYVAAFAPAAGETVQGLTGLNPGSGLADPANLIVRPTPTGADGYINPATFREIFAADLPKQQTNVMAASQRPADVATLGQPSGAPAWATIPSWFVVASKDHTIPPATQQFMAQRAGSKIVTIRSSHVAMMSHPGEVTDVIERAATTTR